MKNRMIAIVMIVLLLLLVTAIGYYVKDATSRQEIKTEPLTSYEKIQIENVNLVTVLIATESSHEPIYVRDKAKIKEIYEALGNIVIGKESLLRTTDDEASYTFLQNDGTRVKFSFEGNNLLMDRKQYEVTGLSKLKNIELK